MTDGPLYEQMKRNILHVNGPDHSRLRSLVNPALSPRAVERYRPAMRAFLEGLLEQALGSSVAGARSARRSRRVPGDGRVRCEFVEAFAKPYPSQVIAQVMGAPLQDAPRLHHWSNWIQRQFDAPAWPASARGSSRRWRSSTSTPRRWCAARREDPGDDLISKLIAAAEPAYHRAAVGRGVHQPRLQRARRRRRHQPEPARARDPAAGRTPRQWALLAAGPLARRGGGRGGAALRADHAVHRAHH